MNTQIRRFIQVLFLGVFLLLMVFNKAQLWMGFIFLSIILATYFGRFYCGFACPINTLMQPISWMGKKFGMQKKEVPEFFKSQKPRWVAFGLFLIGLGYTIYTITQGRKFPLPLIIIPLGLLTTFFVNEKSWHRYLCPWGVLFSLTSKFSKFGIKSNGCTSCGLCKTNCPGDAITVEKGNKAVVDNTHCLLCFECTKICPTKSMSYENKHKIQTEKSSY